jgi:hypothetical protein
MRRKRRRKQRLFLEALEPRVVLDNHLGAAVADVPEGNPFEQFESAEEFQQFLIDTAVSRWEGLFGREAHRWIYTPTLDGAPPPGAGPLVRQLDAPPEDIAVDGTNVQVSGVDEGDIVKTDGEFLYVTGDRQLSIIDLSNPQDLDLVSQIELDSWTSDLFVSGDRLAIISTDFGFIRYADIAAPLSFAPHDFGPESTITVFDISDRTAPQEISTTTIDVSVVTTRRIDDIIYLVTSEQVALPHPEVQCEDRIFEVDPNRPPPGFLPELGGESLTILPDDPNVPFPWPPPHDVCFYETEEEYVGRVAAGLVADVLPNFQVVDADGNEVDAGFLSDPADIYKPVIEQPQSFTSIVTVDMSSDVPAPGASAALLTDYTSLVYVSNDNIYLANVNWHEGGATTHLRQFSLDTNETSIALSSFGEVNGAPLNQFSIDEHEGYLRIFTSSGWGEDRETSLFVLQQDETNLQVVGELNGIAPGENVFAARFLGDQAFLVTFRFIDPFFTIDLSDPTNPTLVGELEIPGFSNYLHPIAEDLVLGLGRDGNQFDSSPQVSLFDASDFSNPQRIGQLIFDDARWTEAFHNHHAISYFEDAQVLVIPFYGGPAYCPYFLTDDGCTPERSDAFWVLQVDPNSAEEPLRLLGTIKHDSSPLRSVRIGDVLFTVSSRAVKANELLNPDSQLDELYFGPIALPDYLHITVESRDSDPTQVEPLDVLANDLVPDATIVAVSDTSLGGTVEISEDGTLVLYSPPAAPPEPNQLHARDHFTYTVEVDGRMDSAEVHVGLEFRESSEAMHELAVADLAGRLGVPAEEIHVKFTRPETWPDSCLGVEPPDAGACAAVVTPGFRVGLRYAHHHFIYHTDTVSTVVLAGFELGLRGDHFKVEGGTTDNVLDVLDNDHLELPDATIVEVSTPEHGEARVSDDGRSILYTPGDERRDAFTYTVELVDGIRGTRWVEVAVESEFVDDDGMLVRVWPEIVDADGKPTSLLHVGEEAFLRLFAEDLREHGKGVFSVYADVEYDPDLVLDIGTIDHGAFANGQSEDAKTPGLIDEVGGFTIGPADEKFFASIPFTAAADGELMFSTNAPDSIPVHEISVFGSDFAVPLDQVEFGEVAVKVVDHWYNVQEPRDTSMDGEVSALDALLIINYLNKHGSRKLDRALRLRPDGEGPTSENPRCDVNNDGFVSPLDALLVINEIRQRIRIAFAEAEAAETFDPLEASLADSGLESSEAFVFLRDGANSTQKTRASQSVRKRIGPRPLTPPISFPAQHDVDRIAPDIAEHTARADDDSVKQDLFAEVSTADDEWWLGE